MADWRYEFYFLVMTIFHQGVSIELPKYAIFIKLPEFHWMRFKSCQLPVVICVLSLSDLSINIILIK